MSTAPAMARRSMLERVSSRARLIRRAEGRDAGAIGAIYDEAIATGVATFAAGPHDAAERRGWLAARGARAPVCVMEQGDTVRAWSALAPFSHRPWYDGVAEYTVYVADDARGAEFAASGSAIQREARHGCDRRRLEARESGGLTRHGEAENAPDGESRCGSAGRTSRC